MEKIEYQKLVDKHKPKETRIKNAVIAFTIGGLIGLLGQYLVELYEIIFSLSSKDAGTYMIITVIFLASLFTGLGFFDKWVTFARCGLIVPITGFAHSLTSTALEYKHEGPIFGIGSNIFKLAGSVILYGIISACFFGIIRYFIGG